MKALVEPLVPCLTQTPTKSSWIEGYTCAPQVPQGRNNPLKL